MNDIIKTREFAKKSFEENKSPVWELTELAIKKGKELSKEYKVNEKLVTISLYLAHSVFSPIWKGEIQKNHPNLSSEKIKPFLDTLNITKEEKEIIINSIEAHHNKKPTLSKEAEIVKNAECFKFITIKGALIFLHELGKRNIPFNESCEKVLEKMNQKKKLLTLNLNHECNEIELLMKRIKE